MSRKDIEQLLDRVRAQGFDIHRGGSGHWRVVAPCGQAVTVPATPGRGRALANTRAALRRIGADL